MLGLHTVHSEILAIVLVVTIPACDSLNVITNFNAELCDKVLVCSPTMNPLVDYFVVCGLHSKSLENELTNGELFEPTCTGQLVIGHEIS